MTEINWLQRQPSNYIEGYDSFMEFNQTQEWGRINDFFDTNKMSSILNEDENLFINDDNHYNHESMIDYDCGSKRDNFQEILSFEMNQQFSANYNQMSSNCQRQSTASNNLKKTKKIVKFILREDQDYDENEESKIETAKMKKSNGKKKNSCLKKKRRDCQTKNMLQAFRSMFLNYLEKKIPKAQFKEIQIVKKLQGQKTMSQEQVNQLFKVQQFQQPLKNYFESRKIYSDLMMKGMSIKFKEIYMRKIYLLERGFNTKQFSGLDSPK